jgi:hypothetical protein
MSKQIFTILGSKNKEIFEIGLAYSQGIAYDFENSIKHIYEVTRVVKGKAKATDYQFNDGFILIKLHN